LKEGGKGCGWGGGRGSYPTEEEEKKRQPEINSLKTFNGKGASGTGLMSREGEGGKTGTKKKEIIKKKKGMVRNPLTWCSGVEKLVEMKVEEKARKSKKESGDN